MSAEAVALPHPAPYTVHDLLEMPDDGSRYEVIDGALIVSPAPSQIHQVVCDALRNVLATAAPAETRVMTAVGVRCGSDTIGRVPDIVVARRLDPRMNPILDASDVFAVVEVVSPGSRCMERDAKATIYAAAGIQSYWRVELDPFPGQLHSEIPPVVLVHELDGAEYKLVDRLSAGRTGTTTLPYAVTFDPGLLEQ